MKPSRALQDTWRWKEEVAREIDGMTAEERIAYFEQAERRLAARTDRELQLPRASRRHR